MYSSCRRVLSGAKNATACIMSLRVLQATIMVDFNLAVSTQTAKPSNLIPRQIFRLYGSVISAILISKVQPCPTSSAAIPHTKRYILSERN